MVPLISYFKLALNPGRGVLFFALRTIVAGLLCLYLAFIFDLEQPKWALMTVIIISLPLAGMALKRSFAQVLGTAAGAAMAVVLMALWQPPAGQRQPELHLGQACPAHPGTAAP